MALVESRKIEIGMHAPGFLLQDQVSGQYKSLHDLKSSKATVVMFICNHCPYVIHLFRGIIDLANKYRQNGVSFVAISSNDVESFPEDGPEYMKIVSKVLKMPFPYLYDKRQEVAQSYQAACTPDFYVFDKDLVLTYHGRMDDSTPGNGKPVTGIELSKAIEATIEGTKIYTQFPSMGCSIKWKRDK